MSYILPPQSEANNLTEEGILAKIATANAAFIASATVLINNAITNSLYEVEPYVIPYLDIPTVTAYFESYGYTVLFPIVPNYPYNPAFVPGFPEVLPPGYHAPFCNTPYHGAPRIKISWNATPPPFAESWLLLENGDLILLENGVDAILLESSA